MCSGMNPKRIDEIRREREQVDLFNAKIRKELGLKPDYKIYCMTCGKNPPLCLCKCNEWGSR